jgi:hypothetical protein
MAARRPPRGSDRGRPPTREGTRQTRSHATTRRGWGILQCRNGRPFVKTSPRASLEVTLSAEIANPHPAGSASAQPCAFAYSSPYPGYDDGRSNSRSVQHALADLLCNGPPPPTSKVRRLARLACRECVVTRRLLVGKRLARHRPLPPQARAETRPVCSGSPSGDASIPIAL